jgi:hypothetical protein
MIETNATANTSAIVLNALVSATGTFATATANTLGSIAQ